jgi:hypothetical protein
MILGCFKPLNISTAAQKSQQPASRPMLVRSSLFGLSAFLCLPRTILRDGFGLANRLHAEK